MTWNDLLAKQGDLAEIYYRQQQALKLEKGREENRRAREKKKLGNPKKIEFIFRKSYITKTI